MATVGFYLDTRKKSEGQPVPLRISLRVLKTTIYFDSGFELRPSEWDRLTERVNRSHPNHKMINMKIQLFRSEIEVAAYDMGYGIERMSPKEIRRTILRKLGRAPADDDLFILAFREFMSSKEGGTLSVYRQTERKLAVFTDLDKLRFSDITLKWLTSFDKYLSATSPSANARSIHLRNIRAVFNYAIDNEMTSLYPFRRFKIKTSPTRKRSLSIEELRTLFAYPTEPHQEYYRDMFKLIFMLIGINAVDLYSAGPVRRGRVEYVRAKTHRLYSIKVEPEALELIERYKGDDNHLLDLHKRWTDHKNFIHQCNMHLKRIGTMERKGRGGKKIVEPLFPEISTYWARHTWATVAYSLGVSRDVIGQALGHADSTVTDIYIDKDQAIVDEANRRVLDWVLYGKR